MENFRGKVIIQTYNPDNFTIICSKEQDYERFYKAEISMRKQLKYPPFCDIILFSVISASEIEIVKSVKFIYEDLIRNLANVAIVYKPQPCPIDKIKNIYRWRIIIKCRFNNNIINLLNKVSNNFQNNKRKFGNTNISIDVNPNNFQ